MRLLSFAFTIVFFVDRALAFTQHICTNARCHGNQMFAGSLTINNFIYPRPGDPYLYVWGLLLMGSYSGLVCQRWRLLVVFSVTPFKIDQNKKSKSFNRLSPESGNRKKVDMQRLSPRFRSQQFFLWKICGETFFPNL